MSDPDRWAESETNDFVPPEFDNIVRDNEVRIYLYETLQDDYKLEPAEAQSAAQSYLWSRTESLPTYPDESFLLGAAGIAYSRWVSVTDPTTVAVRDRTRRVAVIASDIADAEGHLNIDELAFSHQLSLAYLELDRARGRLNEAIAAQQAAASGDPSSTLYNTAYLAGAAATLAEVAAGENPHHPRQVQVQAQQDPGSAVEDLAAAEAAITLLRENRDRHGYTAEDAATAQALRSVLDAAQVWDEVTSSAPVDQTRALEVDLRPDRVRAHPGFDDTVILDAGFAGATITVQRTGPAHQPGEYQFLTAGPGGRDPLRNVDTVGLGVIAAGDHEPRPDRADAYADLGAEVRQHLTGLADAVASQREALHTRETQRAATTQPLTAPTVHTGHQRSL